MRFLDLILKKKAGFELSQADIEYFIEAYTRDDLADYQVAALLMAICWQGMTAKETAYLTLAMARSGDQIDLSSLSGLKVDKHSTGGVGDKTTLIITPIVAALGAKVPKMSGRGLGHTGGTIDKLESIPGLETALSEKAFFSQVERYGLAVAGQTANLAPADKKLYALRDVTGTVDSPALIAASILSKKIAGGAKKIVLDVKCGSGAFMKDYDSAHELAQLMVDIGKEAGLEVHAVISDMDQPLGRAVGNRIEIYEAIQTLKGRGPQDLHDLSIVLAEEMYAFSGQSPAEIEKSVLAVIEDGSALAKFKDLVAAQGGDITYIENPEKLLPKNNGAFIEEFRARESGYLSQINSEQVGLAAGLLGAGRARIEDELDMDAGIYFHKKLGDFVEAGEVVCELSTQDKSRFQAATETLAEAIQIANQPGQKRDLILARLR